MRAGTNLLGTRRCGNGQAIQVKRKLSLRRSEGQGVSPRIAEYPGKESKINF